MKGGSAILAEVAAREAGSITLGQALHLTALIAKKDRARSRRFAARWLQRWLEETPAATIDDAVMVAGLLAALGGDRHDEALSSLQRLL